MGVPSSKLKFNECQRLTVDSIDVLTASISTAYNVIQLAINNSDDVVCYDAREHKNFKAHTMKNALWAWERHAEPAKKKQFSQMMKDEADGKIILVYDESRNMSNSLPFVRKLSEAGVDANVYVLKGYSFDDVKKSRYAKFLVADGSKVPGPLELIPPQRRGVFFRRAGRVFCGAVEDFKKYSVAMRHFNITHVYNLTQEVLPVISRVKYKSLSPNDHVSMALVIHQCMERCLHIILTDYTGNDMSCAAVVAFLCTESVPIETGITYIKQMNPKVDDNFLSTVYTSLMALYSYANNPPVLTSPASTTRPSQEIMLTTSAVQNQNLKQPLEIKQVEDKVDEPLKDLSGDDQDFVSFKQH